MRVVKRVAVLRTVVENQVLGRQLDQPSREQLGVATVDRSMVIGVGQVRRRWHEEGCLRRGRSLGRPDEERNVVFMRAGAKVHRIDAAHQLVGDDQLEVSLPNRRRTGRRRENEWRHIAREPGASPSPRPSSCDPSWHAPVG